MSVWPGTSAFCLLRNRNSKYGRATPCDRPRWDGASYLLNYITLSHLLPPHISRISRISQGDFNGTAHWSGGCRQLSRLAFSSSPRRKCHSVPLFLSNKFLEENLDSRVEYYALKGNFLNESTNSVNYAEPCLLARPLEDGTLGPWTGQAAEQWRSDCCQSPVGFGNVNSVCMWKNTELCFLTLAMLSTAPFHRVCSGNQERQLVRTWHHAWSSEPQAAKAQWLKGLQVQQERTQQVRQLLCTQ